jgi:hypothetical protein
MWVVVVLMFPYPETSCYVIFTSLFEIPLCKGFFKLLIKMLSITQIVSGIVVNISLFYLSRVYKKISSLYFITSSLRNGISLVEMDLRNKNRMILKYVLVWFLIFLRIVVHLFGNQFYTVHTYKVS